MISTRQAKTIRRGILDARRYKNPYGMRKGDLPLFRSLLYERAFAETKAKRKKGQYRELQRV